MPIQELPVECPPVAVDAFHPVGDHHVGVELGVVLAGGELGEPRRQVAAGIDRPRLDSLLDGPVLAPNRFAVLVQRRSASGTPGRRSQRLQVAERAARVASSKPSRTWRRTSGPPKVHSSDTDLSAEKVMSHAATPPLRSRRPSCYPSPDADRRTAGPAPRPTRCRGGVPLSRRSPPKCRWRCRRAGSSPPAATSHRACAGSSRPGRWQDSTRHDPRSGPRPGPGRAAPPDGPAIFV